jgi:D-serine deaminase-like pyridoxal phosphate-dependent protein
MDVRELKTPCALVDLEVLEANAARMAAKAKAMGVRLRPHVKTHKCPEIARLQVAGHFGGITVSTMAEARAFARAGFNDITYAVPVPIPRLSEAANLIESGCDLKLLLDGEETLAEVAACAASRSLTVPVFLKVDCGYHRAGVDPERPESLALAARMAASPHLDFRGILTHAGHAYACRSREEVTAVARQERDVMVRFASRLRNEGLTVREVSVGSTPTAAAIDDLSGVTEMRPGNYAFFDAFQAAIGSCSIADASFSVLATVVGAYPERGALALDAGALALSKDPGPVHVDPACGFGVILPLDGWEPIPGLKLASLSQEHGLVLATPEAVGRLRVGSAVRIVPNHSCLSAACFDRYHAVRKGDVVDEWRPERGW